MDSGEIEKSSLDKRLVLCDPPAPNSYLAFCAGCGDDLGVFRGRVWKLGEGSKKQKNVMLFASVIR